MTMLTRATFSFGVHLSIIESQLYVESDCVLLQVYPYCEKWALSWNWRKHLIIKELKSMAADIITLQEAARGRSTAVTDPRTSC